MPTYTYKCEHCDHVFDARQRVEIRDRFWCPECGLESLRVFTPTANLIVPGHFMLDRGWADPPPGDPAWENMSSPGSRGSIHAKKTPTLKDEFDKVKQWS